MKSTTTTITCLVALLQAAATLGFVVKTPPTSMSRLVSRALPQVARPITTVLSAVDADTETAAISTSGAVSSEQLESTATTDAVSATTTSSGSDKKKNDPTQLFQKIKDAGIAGSISLFLWEGAFWAISVPLAIFGYYQVAGHWPDFSNSEDMTSVGAEAFAFANVARFALPLRIGLAVSTTPWVQANIVDRFFNKDKDE